ncbi:MAG TPA: MOSC domain-containing protein [Bryobacteraceae bacterium]|nr:MOSC domain-containing protein [Bryobacteraceae bacterium]
MQGVVLQINVSQGGIPKRAIAEGRVTRHGIEGDSWAHPRFHGGPKQALLLISAEDLDALKLLGYPVYPGALGENLTVAGIDFRQVRFGDRFHVGEATIEITKLRQPCRTLNTLGSGIQKQLYDTTPGAPLWARGGFYAKVVTEGLIRPGAIIAKATP